MLGHDEIPLPPTVLLAAGVLQRLAPTSTKALPLRHTAAAILAAGSAALLLGTFGVFRDHKTTVDPTAPEEARALVTSGANKVSRNPMYMGMVGLLAAHATWRGSWQAWLPAAAFAATLDRFQIPREERALRGTFGKDYEDYCARTPRWIGRVRN
ncbi:hypothetical protein ART_1920 [Arthrobacter sp. PAMC 25486]|uniref:methyltransferase family protein n=1 Tax=Arthrobacter sp. PAMC 25486 TaxID=1494608 RepID=UPI000535FA68|nr:isoprenylcysteine carboxylmethyltransferase family protein [Arthrobacter sp. PAMC 25486]AIY01519.1 hypothetical protein ART_1920 [Arthrobacter sp. PAMC 25486]